MSQNNSLRAIDLVDKVLEFEKMTPDESTWSLKKLSTNRSCYVRFQQIEALSNALLLKGTKVSISSILSGDFIHSREISQYKELIKQIKDFLISNHQHIEEHDEVHIEELVILYTRLLDFKRKLRTIHNFNSDLMEASYISVRFSIRLTYSISDSIKEIEKELDNYLELIINPREFVFTKEELIAKFNYPKENLIDIDYDYLE